MADTDILEQMISDIGAGAVVSLMDIFQKDADTRLAAVADYLEHGGDVAQLRKQAHSLKGLCLTYGATAAGDAARVLQAACDGDDEAQIREAARTVVDTAPDAIRDARETALKLAGQ
ncbi:MAG: Hpt domain-containing protein [Alphaproteobacteria bacterium]|nr:Hpt domain-containing protein [Alphaproteobacteria bacterium]MBF0251283.1 Hpt domain-containing protein [Alphaproteobacteria bacterium]